MNKKVVQRNSYQYSFKSYIVPISLYVRRMYNLISYCLTWLPIIYCVSCTESAQANIYSLDKTNRKSDTVWPRLCLYFVYSWIKEADIHQRFIYQVRNTTCFKLASYQVLEVIIPSLTWNCFICSKRSAYAATTFCLLFLSSILYPLLLMNAWYIANAYYPNNSWILSILSINSSRSSIIFNLSKYVETNLFHKNFNIHV